MNKECNWSVRQLFHMQQEGGGLRELLSLLEKTYQWTTPKKIQNLSANFVDCVFLNITADDSPFFDHDMPTMRSSSSSSEGLPHVVGLNWEGSVESNEVNTRVCSLEANCVRQCVVISNCIVLHQDSDQCKKSSLRRVNKGHHSKGKTRYGNSDGAHSSGTANCGAGLPPSYTGPKVCVCSGFCTFIQISLSSWQGLKSHLPVGSGRVLGANRLFEVSSITWRARHWPADLSHPDRKWSQRNRDYVRCCFFLFGLYL